MLESARENLRQVSLPFYKLWFLNTEVASTEGGGECVSNDDTFTILVKGDPVLMLEITNDYIQFDTDRIKHCADKVINAVGSIDDVKEALVIEVNRQRGKAYEKAFWDLASIDGESNVGDAVDSDNGIIPNQAETEQEQKQVLQTEIIEVEKIVEKEVPVEKIVDRVVEVEKIVEKEVRVEIEKPSLGLWAKIKRWWGSKTW